MRLAPGYVLCACGWHGKLGAKTPCPACNRAAIDRIDGARLAVLRAVHARPDTVVPTTQRIRLWEIGLLRRESDPVPPNPSGRHKRYPRRRHKLTPMGVALLAAAAALEQQRKESTGEHEATSEPTATAAQASGAQARQA
jgi:hypothetical protein